ncbi:MAG: DUF1272 domain-containing protein [Pseudomonadota bacterium]
MLALRPNCECCDRDLPPDSAQARICTFECTFCADCADSRLGGHCPNCGGELVRRPIRPAGLLTKFPASSERVLKAHAACAPA